MTENDKGDKSYSYDYLIVGAGLFGATFANRATALGKRCLIIDKRNHFAGNAHTQMQNNIWVHKYGAHIFHTDDRDVWNYVKKFAFFSNYVHTVQAFTDGVMYNLPFNMNTFSKLWGVSSPAGARDMISSQTKHYLGNNPNLEEQALSLVGEDIYNTFIKEYTEKQWGCKASELPASIINRLPLRFTYDNRYFTDKYQGIPNGGYTNMVMHMLVGIDYQLGIDYFPNRKFFNSQCKEVIFTGRIDEYFDYVFGELEYRSLRFEEMIKPDQDHQGCAVVNFCDKEVPYTRIIEHKHFDPDIPDTVINHERRNSSVITLEYPVKAARGNKPYYPVNNDKNNTMYNEYKSHAAAVDGLHFGGRLGSYQYINMDQAIKQAMELAAELCLSKGDK